ncbi:hypothetical protein AMECASPLE_011127 [Ameca splendens]|uniref:Uncharacterized protein n=1 Tax=Ameca splendens TaxID=208324 RepID=A0ABV0YC39_9TELE
MFGIGLGRSSINQWLVVLRYQFKSKQRPVLYISDRDTHKQVFCFRAPPLVMGNYAKRSTNYGFVDVRPRLSIEIYSSVVVLGGKAC